ETVRKLAELCKKGMFTGGKNRDYVHSLIKHQVGQSDFKRQLMAGADAAGQQKRLADLKRLLADAGVGDEKPAPRSVDAA
ncbi:MAG: hypothetical protein AAF684_09800, partial [Pseudomonadota bacterium]